MKRSLQIFSERVPKSTLKWPQNPQKSTPREVLEGLGHPLGAKMAQQQKKYPFLGSPRGSKMDPKSIKKMIKNQVDFINDFEPIFFRSWVDLGTQNRSKMTSLRPVSSSSFQICKKYDFEQPSNGFATFLESKSFDFRYRKLHFGDVFPKTFMKMIFNRFWLDFECNMSTKWVPKSILKPIKKCIQFLVEKRVPISARS